MKNTAFCLFMLSFALSGFSQIQLATSGSVLRGSGVRDNHASLIGGGISMKYLMKDKYLIGAAVTAYLPGSTAYNYLNVTDRVQKAVGSFEAIFLRQNLVKTYMGIDLGVSQSTHTVSDVAALPVEEPKVIDNYFLIAPKAGLFSNIGKSTGWFAQVQYNYSPRDGVQKTDMPQEWNRVLREPIRKYWSIDIGLFVRLSAVGKSK